MKLGAQGRAPPFPCSNPARVHGKGDIKSSKTLPDTATLDRAITISCCQSQPTNPHVKLT